MLPTDHRDGCRNLLGLEVLTRQGSSDELDGMLRVSAGTARRVIITEPDEDECDDAESQLRRASGLMLSLQQNAQPVKEKRGAVVVSTPADFANGLAQKASASMGSYAEVAPSSFVSRLLAQCTVQRGLSHVFEELLLQGAGNELYITEPMSSYRQLAGRTFGKAAGFFPSGRVLGVITADPDADDKVLLSPPNERPLEAGDKLIVVADSKRAAKPRARAPREAAEAVEAARSARSLSSYNLPQKLVLLNWNPNMEGKSQPPSVNTKSEQQVSPQSLAPKSNPKVSPQSLAPKSRPRASPLSCPCVTPHVSPSIGATPPPPLF